MPTATTTNEFRRYELMVILSGDLPEGDFEKELNEIRKLLKENTKAVSYEDSWGRRDLAYRIKRKNAGYYAIFNFHAAPESLTELRMAVKLNPHILRHLLIILPEDYVVGQYKTQVLRDEKRAEEAKEMRKPRAAKKIVPVELERMAAELKPPTVAGKEDEEKLKKVEKKLEEILENPDIEIK